MFPNPLASAVVSMYGLKISGSSTERAWYNFRFERRQKGLVMDREATMPTAWNLNAAWDFLSLKGKARRREKFAAMSKSCCTLCGWVLSRWADGDASRSACCAAQYIKNKAATRLRRVLIAAGPHPVKRSAQTGRLKCDVIAWNQDPLADASLSSDQCGTERQSQSPPTRSALFARKWFWHCRVSNPFLLQFHWLNDVAQQSDADSWRNWNPLHPFVWQDFLHFSYANLEPLSVYSLVSAIAQTPEYCGE